MLVKRTIITFTCKTIYHKIISLYKSKIKVFKNLVVLCLSYKDTNFCCHFKATLFHTFFKDLIGKQTAMKTHMRQMEQQQK